MEGNMSIEFDKLPIKRLEAIEEAGIEHFPPDVGPEERRVDQIRKIDFSSVVERNVKQKKSSEEKAKKATSTVVTPPWPWQILVENLQLAHQELSVIIDIINTVETNDAVTVAGMTRPKPLPNEVLSDLSVSAATKLQSLRSLGKYFKQSSKALEKQVAKETRFYSALIRLQHNWKVKRHRLAASGPGSEGFMVDLLDNSLSDSIHFSRSSSSSTVRVDHDSTGMLTVQLPPRSCHFLHFGFHGSYSTGRPINSSRKTISRSSGKFPRDSNKEAISEEDVNECVKASHSVLRDIHRAIFEEQVFDMVNRETFKASSGVQVIGIREDFLQLGAGQETSVFFTLLPAEQDLATQKVDPVLESSDEETVVSHSKDLELMVIDEKHNTSKQSVLGFPDPACFQVYLKQILHERRVSKAKEGQHTVKSQVSNQTPDGGPGLIGHYCKAVAHRIFSRKVLSELENLASGIPYLHLLTQPTWHSRISTWSLSVKVPLLVLHAGQRQRTLDTHEMKDAISMRFHTKVVLTDECITVSGEGLPSVIGSFGGDPMNVKPLSSYGCDLVDLPMILLLQVAGQVIRWLHEEALIVGMKASRDFLCLYFELEEGNKIGLMAHVDPDDVFGCISWWLVMDDDGSMAEGRPRTKFSTVTSENRRFLGNLSLEALYSTLMDLVSLCSSDGSIS